MNRIGCCVIVGAGDVCAGFLPEKRKEDLWIAADAGYRILGNTGIRPDLYVGDGDSLKSDPDIPERIIFPRVKDETDSLAAVRCGMERGYRRFCLFGALGGSRFSHSVANVQTLLYIRANGCDGVIASAESVVRILDAGLGPYPVPFENASESGKDGPYVSLFAVAGDAVVSISNAEYEAERLALTPEFPLGVSNEPREGCLITVHSGKVLAVMEPGRRMPSQRFDPEAFFPKG